MSKRKILLLAMAVMMAAILAIGGTLAYFTDEDEATNVFTMGNVEIDLEEDFVPESNLQPGLDVKKEAWVVNTGSNDAYVRVHIAIPAQLDDGDPTFAAVNNFLHFNFSSESVQPGKWSWTPDYVEDEVGYRGNGKGNWNFYTDTLPNASGTDELYNIYVVTYRTALKPGEQTDNAIENVYLDKSVNAEAIREDGKVVAYKYFDNKGNVFTLPTHTVNGQPMAKIDIKVWAEATQTATFTDAYDALNTSFGTPGTEGYVSPWKK